MFNKRMCLIISGKEKNRNNKKGNKFKKKRKGRGFKGTVGFPYILSKSKVILHGIPLRFKTLFFLFVRRNVN